MYRTSVILVTAALMGGLLSAHGADGELIIVNPARDATFETGAYRFGQADLVGYIGYLKDRHKIRGLLMRNGNRATDEHRHLLAAAAKLQQVDALIEIDGKEQPLVDPDPAPSSAGPLSTPTR